MAWLLDNCESQFSELPMPDIQTNMPSRHDFVHGWFGFIATPGSLLEVVPGFMRLDSVLATKKYIVFHLPSV